MICQAKCGLQSLAHLAIKTAIHTQGWRGRVCGLRFRCLGFSLITYPCGGLTGRNSSQPSKYRVNPALILLLFYYNRERITMSYNDFTMRQLLEAGVHFGHHTRRWNPKMSQYIFGERNNVHIINLEKTVPMLHAALKVVRDTAANGGRVLFVGTKRTAQDPIAEVAKRCGQFYVNSRWLGGMLTNWKTISNSIKRLKTLDEQLGKPESSGFTKREILSLQREKAKLEKALGGIKSMGGLPDVIVVIDTNKEAIAIAEARRLGIPVVAIVDSNCNPDGINYIVPGNDDALRAINLYCELFGQAVLDGLQAEAGNRGGKNRDAGAEAEPVVEEIAASA